MTASRRRALAFGIVVLACVAAAVGYAWHLMRQASAASAAAPIGFVPLDALPGASGTAPRRAFMLFRSTALGESYGRVGLVYLDAPDDTRQIARMQCDRLHYAAGRGVCLEAQRGALTSYTAHLFDDKFAVLRSYPLAGPPSRTRVSPDGRLAAFTVFVNGHGYATPGFTTRTSIVDTMVGSVLVEDLEAWPVERDGQVFKAADFNFWGVTFAPDGRRFFATLGTGGKTFLLEGDIAARRLRVIQSDVECPSLSPDGLRIAFKQRESGAGSGRHLWRLHVMDLATAKLTTLNAETRNVDDQVEWLDAARLLYALPQQGALSSAGTDVWSIAADGSGAPELYLPAGFSPAITR